MDLEVKIDKTYEAMNIQFKNNQIQTDGQVDEIHQLINIANQQISEIQDEMGNNDMRLVLA